MQGVVPPLSEDPVERMRFYAFLYTELEHRKQTLDLIMQAHDATERRMHVRMDEMHRIVDDMDRKMRHDDTRLKTLMAAAIVMWSMVGGVVAWLWEGAASKATQHIEMVGALKGEVKDLQTSSMQLQNDINLTKALRGQIQTLQDDIKELQVRR